MQRPFSGRGGVLWRCPQCRGASSMISTMRTYVPREMVNSFWNAARNQPFARNRICPSCRQPMAEVPVSGESFAIDVCTRCGFVWFDSGEYQQLPKTPEEVPPVRKTLPPEITQRMALSDVERLREAAHIEKSVPDETWKYIPALLGVPVEFDSETVHTFPAVTLSLMMLIAGVSLLGFAGILPSSVFGLVPAQWARWGGLTFLTSFFLHGGVGHLLGNLYFLYIFGDNVEEVQGRVRFLVLLAASTLVGGMAHVMMNPDSIVPCIGASGGISGVLAYYALRFPRHRIGILIFFCKWIRFPVIAYLAVWMLFQIMGLLSGAGRVAYMAHIGGLLTGFAFWASERFSRQAH